MRPGDDCELVRQQTADAIRHLAARFGDLDPRDSYALAPVRRDVLDRLGDAAVRIPPAVFLHATLGVMRERFAHPGKRPGPPW